MMSARRPWSLLDREACGRSAIVMGNGPSRANASCKAAARRAVGDGALVIGCNAYWVDVRDYEWPAPDYLVCYDGMQGDLALRHCGWGKIIIPEQRDDPVLVHPRGAHDVARLWIAAPHIGTAEPGHYLEERWHPRVMALGNLSGLLAMQLALILGAKSVHLLGIDCGGILSGDRVSLSSVGEGAPGYGPSEVPRSTCKEVAGAWLPDSWEQQRSCWRALTRKAEQLGVRVSRLTGGGTLDWLDVDGAASEGEGGPDRRLERLSGLQRRHAAGR